MNFIFIYFMLIIHERGARILHLNVRRRALFEYSSHDSRWTDLVHYYTGSILPPSVTIYVWALACNRVVTKQRREAEDRRSIRGGVRNADNRNAEREYQWQEQPEVRVTFTVSNVKCGLIIGRRE